MPLSSPQCASHGDLRPLTSSRKRGREREGCHLRGQPQTGAFTEVRAEISASAIRGGHFYFRGLMDLSPETRSEYTYVCIVRRHLVYLELK